MEQTATAAGTGWTAKLDAESAALIFVPGPPPANFAFQGPGAAVRFCLVDASNLAALRRRLAADDAPKTFPTPWGPASDSLAKELENPAFDVRMDNDYEEIDWATFATWPRAPERKGRNARKNFGAWQAEQRWGWRVVAATIPELAPPDVLETRREAGDVRVSSARVRRADIPRSTRRSRPASRVASPRLGRG